MTQHSSSSSTDEFNISIGRLGTHHLDSGFIVELIKFTGRIARVELVRQQAGRCRRPRRERDVKYLMFYAA